MKYPRIVMTVVLFMGILVVVSGCFPTNSPPVASFIASPTSGPAPLTVSFDASGSSDPDGTIASYSWSFGDGQNGAGVSGNHVYENEGTYTAVLTVIDNDGAMATTSQTIQVTAPENATPTASFTANPESGAAPLTVNFNASASSDPDGTIASYSWSFGDGGNATGVTAMHTYASAGTYVVILTIIDNDGAMASASRSIEVTEPGNTVPTASFTADPESGTFPLDVDFDASASVDPDGSIVSYHWNFGDGHTGTGVTVSHTFETFGTFTVIITVIDDEGAPASATMEIKTYFEFLPIQPPFLPPF